MFFNFTTLPNVLHVSFRKKPQLKPLLETVHLHTLFEPATESSLKQLNRQAV
jgi:hypothetical protein